MNNFSVQWQEPPTDGYRERRERLAKFALDLREHPWRWAVYPNPLAGGLSNIARGVNEGKFTAMRTGYEAIVSGGQVYVRYTGR